MKKYLFALILFLNLSRTSWAGTISVSAFTTPDDVTVTHLEQQRTTFQTAINSADGGLLQTGTVTTAKMDANANPENRWKEAFNDFVYSGLLPPTSANLTSTTTAGTAYIKGVRVVKDATSKTYTASKHTFVDLSSSGTYTYSEVAINATEPAVTTNSIRLCRVSTDATTVLSVRDDRVMTITLTSTVGSTGMTLVSNTAISGANNTGNIAITATRNYLIVMDFHTISANDTFILRFNNDTTASYSYAFNGYDSAANTITGSNNSTTGINIGPAAGAGGTNLSTRIGGNFKYMGTAGTYVRVVGHAGMRKDTGAAEIVEVNWSGLWAGGTAPTSFRILTSGGATFSGNVYVYGLPTS